MNNTQYSNYNAKSLEINLFNSKENNKLSNNNFHVNQGREFSSKISPQLNPSVNKTIGIFQNSQRTTQQNLTFNLIPIRKSSLETNNAMKLLIENSLKSFSNVLNQSNYVITTLDQELIDLREDIIKIRNSDDDYSPEKFSSEVEYILDTFIDKTIKEGKILKKVSNNEYIQLTSTEAEELKTAFKNVFKEYFFNQLSSTQPKEKDKNKEVEVQENKVKVKMHTAIVLNRNKLEFLDPRQNLIVIDIQLLVKVIISNIINETLEHERTKQRKIKELLDLIDQINSKIINREILNREIAKSEISLQELKHRLNQYIHLPIDEIVKISKVYDLSGKSLSTEGEIHLQLPGIHKMKALSATA